jgi:hypothetical protein
VNDQEWRTVRTLLCSRAAFAAAVANDFAGLSDDQRRALRKGMLARARVWPNTVRRGTPQP